MVYPIDSYQRVRISRKDRLAIFGKFKNVNLLIFKKYRYFYREDSFLIKLYPNLLGKVFIFLVALPLNTLAEGFLSFKKNWKTCMDCIKNGQIVYDCSDKEKIGRLTKSHKSGKIEA